MLKPIDRVLSAVYWRTHVGGEPTTYRQVATDAGLGLPWTRELVHRLVGMGLVSAEPGRQRTILVTDEGVKMACKSVRVGPGLVAEDWEEFVGAQRS